MRGKVILVFSLEGRYCICQKKKNQENVSFNSCRYVSVIGLVSWCSFVILIVISFPILRSDTIFVLTARHKTISRDKNRYRGHSLSCYTVITLIKVQIFHKKLYVARVKNEKMFGNTTPVQGGVFSHNFEFFQFTEKMFYFL